MKFKVGDKVKVRGDRINSDYCMHTALELAPLIVNGTTITRATAFGYMIRGSKYWWTDAMLEAVPTEDEPITNTNIAPSVAKFKIGDRVKCVKSDENPHVIGRLGTVIDYNKSTDAPLVEFDCFIGGIAGCFTSKRGRGGIDGYCWYCKPHELAPATEPQRKSECTQKIVITSDGKESTATLYDGDKEIKTATAGMPKGVDFDFMGCAKRALKLLAKECAEPKSPEVTPPLFNGTVVCIENSLDPRAFTIGKTYYVVDGVLLNNVGFRYEPIDWLNNDPTSGFCVYNTVDGPLVKFVVLADTTKAK